MKMQASAVAAEAPAMKASSTVTATATATAAAKAPAASDAAAEAAAVTAAAATAAAVAGTTTTSSTEAEAEPLSRVQRLTLRCFRLCGASRHTAPATSPTVWSRKQRLRSSTNSSGDEILSSDETCSGGSEGSSPGASTPSLSPEWPGGIIADSSAGEIEVASVQVCLSSSDTSTSKPVLLDNTSTAAVNSSNSATNVVPTPTAEICHINTSISSISNNNIVFHLGANDIVESNEVVVLDPHALAAVASPSQDVRSLDMDIAGAADHPDLQEEGLSELMESMEPDGSFSGLGGTISHDEKLGLCRRLLRKYNGNVSLCKPRLKQALIFRGKHDALFQSRDYALAGDYRVIGEDLERRPVLYTCMRNQILPYTQFRDQQVVTMLNAIELMRNGAGSAIQICDLHGMRLRFSDMNPSPLVEWARTQENFFAGMMHEVIVVDMPRMATVLKEALWPLMPAGVRQKIKFMTFKQAEAHVLETCDAYVADHILEVMRHNRESSDSLTKRQLAWERYAPGGVRVPLVPEPATSAS